MEPIRNGMFAGTDYKLDQLEKHLKKRPAYNSVLCELSQSS